MKTILCFIVIALFLTSCSNPGKSYQKSINSRELNDFQKIVNKYPESEFADSAKLKIIDVQYWNFIDSSIFKCDYENYIDSFQNGLFQKEAELMINEIELFNSVREKDIISNYISFQENFPQSLFKDSITSRINFLEPAKKRYNLLKEQNDIDASVSYIIEFSETGYANLILSKLDSLNKIYYKNKGILMPDLITFMEDQIFLLVGNGRLNPKDGYKFVFVCLTFNNGLKNNLTIDLDSVYIEIDKNKKICKASGIFPHHFPLKDQITKQYSVHVPYYEYPGGISSIKIDNNVVQLSGFRQNSASYQLIFEVPENFILNKINWYGRDLLSTKYNHLQTIALQRKELDAINLAIVDISKAGINLKIVTSPGDTIKRKFEISEDLLTLISKYPKDKLRKSSTIEGIDMKLEKDNIDIIITKDATFKVEFNGVLNEKVQFIEGTVGLYNGKISVKEGTEVRINDNYYKYSFLNRIWILSEYY